MKGDFLFKTTARRLMDNPHAVNLVDVRFRIGDHQHGIPGCFDLKKVEGFLKVNPSILSPYNRETGKYDEIPCEVATVSMEGGVGYGPITTDDVIFYVYQRSVSNLDVLLKPLRLEDGYESTVQKMAKQYHE